MINRIINSYVTSLILKSLKGKKRWILIIVLILAQIFQTTQGFDLTDFVAEIEGLLNDGTVQ
jgi:hypothetical protein